MPRLWAYLLLVFATLTVTLGQDIDVLKAELEAVGIEAVFPDEADYAEASAACEIFLLIPRFAGI